MEPSVPAPVLHAVATFSHCKGTLILSILEKDTVRLSFLQVSQHGLNPSDSEPGHAQAEAKWLPAGMVEMEFHL